MADSPSYFPEGRRVALFRKSFLPYSQTFIHDEIRHHQRYAVTVFTRKWHNIDRFPGHEVVWLERHPGEIRRFESLVYKLFCRSTRFDAVFSQRRFDVVHAHFGYDGIYALPFARRHSLPLVVTLHGHDVSILMSRERYQPKYLLYWLTRKRLFRSTAIFLAVSDELRDLVISLGCPPERVTVLPVGVDLSRFAPGQPLEGHPPRVVMVGRMVEKKGFRYGIEAFLQVVEGGVDAELVIVGDGPLMGELKESVERSGSARAVTFTGSLSHEETAALLRTAGILLAPSVVTGNLDREGSPTVIKEAAACGVPVIGSLHGGIPDLIDDGRTGYLVQERDVGSLADRLGQLLADEGLRLGFGRNARLKMEQQYGIDRYCRRLEEIYDAVIADALEAKARR